MADGFNLQKENNKTGLRFFELHVWGGDGAVDKICLWCGTPSIPTVTSMSKTLNF